MRIPNRLRRALCLAAGVCVLAAIVSACGSSGGSTGGGSGGSGGAGTTTSASGALNIKQTGPGLTEPSAGSGTRTKGGTITFAEEAASPPNYIFPMYSAEYCTPNNIGGVIQLLYRPLYWFGNNYSPVVDYGASIGQKPVFSGGGKVVTIHLNHYMWSNGEQVSARDVVFWLNVIKANPTKFWCNTAPGRFPYNIVGYKAINTTTLQLTFPRAYNQTWLVYNVLSQLTPMPIAWDRTSLSQSAPSPTAAKLPDTTKAGATAVYNFLNAQSQKISSWGSSPLWSVVDGPWRVESTTSNGGVTFVPNKSWSGSPKPSIAKFVEVPFTSESAMIDQIKSQGAGSLDVAYIPSQYQPLTSQFKSQGYDVNMASIYETTFTVLNHSAPKVGVIFKQLYARQALQHLVDQSGWIEHFLHGTAVPTYGPVPLAPPSPLISASSERNPYPFDVSAAAALLKANGWKVVPGGQSTCVKPGTGHGQCGAGVARGQAFAFTINYLSANQAVAEEMQDLQSQAAKVGIKISLTTHPYDEVAGQADHCTEGTPLCDWDADNYGAGWGYGPSYYPSGDTLFDSTSYSNLANYVSPAMDKLVAATVYAKPSQEVALMDKFARFTAVQVPYLWTPQQVGAYGFGDAGTLVNSKIGGFTANAFGAITPEDWYLTK